MSAGATGAALSGGNVLQGAVIGGMLGGIGGGIYSIPGVGMNGVYAMLGAGAVYAGVSGGWNGLAYYAGGVLGGIAGTVAGYELQAPSTGASGQTMQDDPLIFNGKRVDATDANGNVINTWDATSGKNGTTAADQSTLGGPIPESNGYSVDATKIQRWTELSFFQKIGGIFFRGGQWPGGPGAWGFERVQIDIPNGSILGRSGFYFHEGLGTETFGCIKIQSGGFFNYLRAQPGKVPLTVKY